MKNCTLGLGGIAGIYFAVIIYYLWQLRHWMEKFADFDIIKEIGEEQGLLNLSTKYAQESTVVGMIVYVLVFYSFMDRFKKRIQKTKSLM